MNLYEPVSKYGDRLNQIDLRFTKIVNVGHGRIDLNVDFYNAFNSDAMITRTGRVRPGVASAADRHPAAIREVPGAVRFLAERASTPNTQLPTSQTSNLGVGVGNWEFVPERPALALPSVSRTDLTALTT